MLPQALTSENVTVYHYTSVENYRKMQIPDAEGRTGLLPRSPFGDERATFAFHDPIPMQWITSYAWMELKEHMDGVTLLEVSVDPSLLVVVDDSHTDREKTLPGNQVSYRDYMNGLAAISRPEVVIRGIVPLDRVRVSELQPIIEADIECRRINGLRYRYDLERYANIPEYQEWFSRYTQDITQERYDQGEAVGRLIGIECGW